MHEGHQEWEPAYDPKELELGKPKVPGAEDPELPVKGLPENNPINVPDKTKTPFDKPLPEIGDVSNEDEVPEKNLDDYRETQ